MIRCLFLIHDLDNGGAEKVLVNLVNNLDKRKYDITVQTLFDVGHNKRNLNNDVHYISGAKKMFRGNITLMNMISPGLLCKTIIKGQYDLVISFLEGSTSRILSAYNGKKVSWIHTDFFNKEIASTGFRNFEEAKKCYSKFDRIIAVSDIVRDDFNSIFEFSGICETLYNVNDSCGIIELSNESQSGIVKTDKCFNIISVGKLECVTKGFDNLIRIHKKLLDSKINNKLFILGEGADRDKLEKIIDESGVSNSCKLIGFSENPYKYVANADLFVCSSHREGFSTAVTEALILGVPVVSTNVSGAKELLGKNNEYGIVTVDSEESLFDGICSMLTDSQVYDHYKSQAEIRGKEFSSEITTKAVENMFESVLNNEY